MNEFSRFPTRKEHRLKTFDYSADGAYFITICTKDHKALFWDVGARIARPERAVFQLSPKGRVVAQAIENITLRYPNVLVENYVIMPNHVHLLLRIETSGRAMRAPTISTVINQMKGYVSKQIGQPIWQKLFYDHVIRNGEDFQMIWKYIDENPVKWNLDKFYCE